MIRKLSIFFIIAVTALIINYGKLSASPIYVDDYPVPGKGINALINKYELSATAEYLKLFKILNKDKLQKSNQLKLGIRYNLPIEIRKFNGISIRSSIGISDYDKAKRIEIYNDEVFRKGIKSNNFRMDSVLWVPMSEIPDIELTEITFPIFGKNFNGFVQKDNALKGSLYYLVSGHGGPDPGAIGERDGHKLCEDEYAYDITLRLGLNLLEHGASVFFIVRDSSDGIREDEFLLCDSDEYYYGEDTIDVDQLIRLTKRADIINNLYHNNKDYYKSQRAIMIHVDSRSKGKRIDIFFYHHETSSEGKKFADKLMNKIQDKYDMHQPGRGYVGSVSNRNLFMMRKTTPTSVYIELGNIQNPQDQIRFIDPLNRQAIANWLFEGIQEFEAENTK